MCNASKECKIKYVLVKPSEKKNVITKKNGNITKYRRTKDAGKKHSSQIKH